MQLQRKRGFYEKYIKRILDILCASLALLVFWWLYVIVALLVRLKLGKPIVFNQPRPGLIDKNTGIEHVFMMYKFRTMTDERDEHGQLLPDEIRLTKFGRALRSTSLDELPEVFCILKGDMSIVGPRPQLVRDVVFMSDKHRMRHTAKPGLTGLAQIMGRNAINWEDKLDWDLKYIEEISFINDIRIVWITVKKVFFRKHITESNKEIDITLDYGDALLKSGAITQKKYDSLQVYAKQLLEETM